MKKVLITGGFGFIGSNFLKKLLLKNIYKIIVIDKFTYATNYNINFFKKHKYLKIYKEDIINKKKISNILKKEKPNIIINLAAESHVDNSIKRKNLFLNTNIFGLDSLLSACKNELDLSSIKIIHFSTDEVYGTIPLGKFSNEDNTFKPSSFYSSTKAAGESLAYTYLKYFNLPLFILNPCNIFGSFQHPEKFIPKVILNSFLNKSIPVYGSGLQTRQWLHVDNLVNYTERSFFNSNKFGKYNICSDFEINNLALINIIHFVLKKNFNLNNLDKLIKNVDDRVNHDTRYFSSNKKIIKTFKNNEILSLNKTKFKINIQNTIDWYIKNYNKFL